MQMMIVLAALTALWLAILWAKRSWKAGTARFKKIMEEELGR